MTAALTYEQWRERWEKARAAERLIYRPDKKISRASVRSVVAFLRGVRSHKDKRGRLSDPRFDNMARAIEGFRFDRSSRPAYFRHVEAVCVARIVQLVCNNGTSVRLAAARAATEFFVEAQSFDAVVKRLERRTADVGFFSAKKRTTNPKQP